ncbi:MAG: hypothetical protein UW60_C0017G0007 [Candidatus Woesebacteria bacterium GW2011_GWA2_44_33]|uniref:Glycosyltransferase RgtA/B/C/D-like domain-containing protein n=3 Tax=Microgenomates group TaxID=1794810 RepID=A0A0G1N9H0_9BACT|nr:MAG: hypothetical protein UW60_C0017G0007 [Candidatus Woesebacteria bacterium GW2011_GWA2_44_33]KKT67025.1 MAG: hypothetical protein UW61_C0017G0002 [Candidatus Curtissbacteria bacterium GW2011_GWC1_44_33]KKU17199.1 MAG: hypothetical protein UX25_C0014G0018 [Candidatus Woesebacteria bacterium GW2011_GWC2_45_9]
MRSIYKILLPAILLLALFLRVLWLDKYPVGFTQDEAGLGYDAYSIAKTGKDMWGETLPLTLRSFGDYKLPLYSYLAIPSVSIFGLNEFAVRLPGAIFGTLAILACYLMVKKLSENENLAIYSALFLTLSPWHISLSRGAFEANLTTFFIPLGVWGFLEGMKNSKMMMLAAVLFGLNLFAYHPARLFTPLIVAALVFLNRKQFFEDFAKYKLPVFIFLLFLGVSLSTAFWGGAATRGADLAIFNPTDNWASVSDRRYEGVMEGLPDWASRIFSNKVTYVLRTFTHNYLTYVSPGFLFIQGAGEWTYGMISGRGVLYLFEIVLLIAAIIAIVKRQSFKGVEFILLWLVLAPIPAALTKGSGYAANRAAVLMPAIQILSAYGLVYLQGVLKTKFRNFNIGKYLVPGVIFVFSLSFVSFSEDYLYHAPAKGAESMKYGMGEAVSYINENQAKYDQVVVSRSLGVPHIWVAFYEKIDPRLVQEASLKWAEQQQESGVIYTDQLGSYRLGKYVFGDINLEDIIRTGKKSLVVGRAWEFKVGSNIVKTVGYQNQAPLVLIVDPLVK